MSSRPRGAAVALAVIVAAGLGAPACLIQHYEKIGVGDPTVRSNLSGSTIVYSMTDGLYLARGDGSDRKRLIACETIGHDAAIFLEALDPTLRRVLFLSVTDRDGESTGRDLTLNILALREPAAPGVAIGEWRRSRLEKIAPPGADGRQEIFTVAGASWSRDGSRLALGLHRPAGGGSGGGDAVALFDSAGTPLAEYSLGKRDLSRVTGLSWTRDDQAIVLGLEAEDHPSGVVARLDLQSPRSGAAGPRLADIGAGRYPAVSPDGEKIAVIDDASGHGALVLIGLDGKELSRYERPAGRAPNRPFWSPTGNYVYYYSLGATGPLGLLDVTILRCLDIRTQRVFDLVRLG